MADALPSYIIKIWEGLQVQCRKCHTEMPEDGKFCPYCGTRQEREPRKALKRANGTGMCGGIILHRQEDLKKAYYGIHT